MGTVAFCRVPGKWAIDVAAASAIAALAAAPSPKAAIRSALNELANRHGIPRKDVDYAVEGYADDMLSDATYHVERALEELEHEDPV